VKIYSNTTPLLAFASIERFDILQAVHGQIHIVETIWKECQSGIPIVVPDLAKLDWVCLVGSPRVVDGRFLALDAGERDGFSCHMELQAYCESLCSKSTSKGRGRLGFSIACDLHAGGIFKR
jgi:predicted nucleic acid-binding protein